MPLCIFCLQEKENITEEHVYPAALGGTLVLKDCVCSDCNHGFSKFEQPLLVELRPVRFLLQIPDRMGKVPGVFATAKTASRDYEAKITSDGTVLLKPEVTEEKDAEGRRVFIHRFLTPRAKRKLRKLAKKKGYELIEEGPGEPAEAEVHFGGELECIGSLEGLRTAAKIAYVGLAYRAGPKVAASEQFQAVRDFVLKGAGQGISRLFVNETYMNAVQQGPHQHSVTLAGRKDKTRVDAIVRLFGGLCYFVVLSTNYDGADFCDTLVFDAYRGRRDKILLAHPTAELLQTEDVLNSSATVWENLPEAGARFLKFLDDAIAAKQKKSGAEGNRTPTTK
jgi:hypothetical protein